MEIWIHNDFDYGDVRFVQHFETFKMLKIWVSTDNPPIFLTIFTPCIGPWCDKPTFSDKNKKTIIK